MICFYLQGQDLQFLGNICVIHNSVEHTRTLLEHLQQEGKHEGALNFHPM